MSKVTMKIPDFVDPRDGVAYTDIELIVESEGDVRDAAKLTNVIENNFQNTKKEKRHE